MLDILRSGRYSPRDYGVSAGSMMGMEDMNLRGSLVESQGEINSEEWLQWSGVLLGECRRHEWRGLGWNLNGTTARLTSGKMLGVLLSCLPHDGSKFRRGSEYWEIGLLL